MFNPDFIGIYDNALPSDQCKYIIEWMDCQSLERGTTLKGVDLSLKNSWDICNKFSNKNFVDVIIRKVLNKYTPSYRKSYPIVDMIDPWDIHDDYNMQKYDPGGGYHILHCENSGAMDPLVSRVLVWMIYLNTVTDKGGTYFSHYNKTIKAKEGRLVIWPAHFTHPHKGVVSKTQTKYITTGWFNYI
jgi:hypothetical protein